MFARQSFRSAVLILAIGLALELPATLRAQEKKADVTGTWKWTQEGFGGSLEFTLTLKQDGEKLTGTLAGGFDQSEVTIQDGKVKDGDISFKVTRDFGGQAVTTLYTGKVAGDGFKGKSETIFAQPIDAKRAK